MSGTFATATNLSIALNSNRDFYLDDASNLAMVTGVKAVATSCQSRVEAQLREMIYAYNQGMPTMDTVFRQKRIAQFIAAARIRIASVPGVVQVQSVTASVANNQLSYTAVFTTIYSPTAQTLTNGV